MTARVDRKGKSIREVAKGTGYARSTIWVIRGQRPRRDSI